MREVLYRVATSLDGYIAGPHGELDWIVPDPSVDFAKVYESVDTVLLGRRTYELTRQPGAPPGRRAGRSTCSHEPFRRRTVQASRS